MGAGKRGFTSIFLEPLPPEAMEMLLLAGPLPGLPGDILEKILQRAEGVPFYAVETVRMLLDRGLIIREGNVFRSTGPIETLEVPETLQALIAARLDGLATEERRLPATCVRARQVVHASGAGRGDRHRGVAARVHGVLTVHKEVLGVTTDPMSPNEASTGSCRIW